MKKIQKIIIICVVVVHDQKKKRRRAKSNDQVPAEKYNTMMRLLKIQQAKTEEEKTIIANLEAGRTYYLRCTVGAGLFIGRPKFRFVEHSVGKVEFEKLKNN